LPLANETRSGNPDCQAQTAEADMAPSPPPSDSPAKREVTLSSLINSQIA
jgi:hypothetical protein